MDVLPDGVSKVLKQEGGRTEEERKISISIYCINCNKWADSYIHITTNITVTTNNVVTAYNTCDVTTACNAYIKFHTWWTLTGNYADKFSISYHIKLSWSYYIIKQILQLIKWCNNQHETWHATWWLSWDLHQWPAFLIRAVKHNVFCYILIHLTAEAFHMNRQRFEIQDLSSWWMFCSRVSLWNRDYLIQMKWPGKMT